MTVFSPLSTAISSLQAQDLALQTIGNNIANETTPGYSREEVQLQQAIPTNMVRFVVGNGVDITGILRVVDNNLETQLQGSASSLNFQQVKNNTFWQVESLLNTASGTDVGGLLNSFFSSINNLVNNPADTSTRNVVIQQAKTLSATFNSLLTSANTQRSSLNDQVKSDVSQINTFTSQIASLNNQIVSATGGGNNLGAANSLMDQRGLLIKQLAALTNVQTVADSQGNVNILVGSNYLVFGSNSFQLTTTDSADSGIIMSTPQYASSGSSFTPTSGALGALLQGRDTDLKSFIQNLNVLANSVIDNFNKVNSTGQPITKFSDITSVFGVTDPTFPVAIPGSATANALTQNSITDSSLAGIGAAEVTALTGRSVLILSGNDVLQRATITSVNAATGTLFLNTNLTAPIQAGDKYQIGDLNFPVQNGSFNIVMTNQATGVQTTQNITVNLNNITPATTTNTTLNNIRTQINAAFGGGVLNVPAFTGSNKIEIQSLQSGVTFSFSKDTSGFLAAIGLGNMFTGQDAGTMGVNQSMVSNPLLLAAATSNSAGDNSNAINMANLRTQSLVQGNFTFEGFYKNIVGNIAQSTAQSKDLLKSQQSIDTQLQNQREQVSGVNINEEATAMILHQRAFQASARVVSTIDQMLNTLINNLT